MDLVAIAYLTSFRLAYGTGGLSAPMIMYMAWQTAGIPISSQLMLMYTTGALAVRGTRMLIDVAAMPYRNFVRATT